MSDEELRELERRAAQGDAAAAEALDALRARLGLGWEGETLPRGIARGSKRPLYRVSPRHELELVFVRSDVILGVILPMPEGQLADPLPADGPRDELEAALDAGIRWFALDMSSTPNFAGVSLGAFLDRSPADPRQGAIFMFGIPSRMRDVVRMLGFDEFFRIHDTREQVLAAIRALTI